MQTMKTDETILHGFLAIFFAVLSVWTILSCVLVCAVNLRQKGMLKTSYNRHIFHLAIADLFTAIMIAVTPGFITTKILPAPEKGKLGEIHCRIILSHFIIFTLFTSSIYISSSLALERWYAVVRPLQYRTKFHTRRLVAEILLIWTFSIVINSSLPFELSYETNNPTEQRCNISWRHFSTAGARRFLSVVQFLGKFFIPLLLTCALYVALFRKTRSSRLHLSHRKGADKRNRICRMSAASAVALAVCWFPNQVYYALYKFDLVELNTSTHHLTIALAMLNSCLNPFIFAFHSEQYRNGFKKIVTLSVADNRTSRIRQCTKYSNVDPLTFGLRDNSYPVGYSRPAGNSSPASDPSHGSIACICRLGFSLVDNKI